ncbi:MAG: hypothetical protein WCF85_13005 [Rhodospirillaceae bacterium]
MADDSNFDIEETRKAIELLIEAVAKEIKPGVLEVKLAASTLRDLLEDPNPRAFDLALRAFNAIDPDIRKRIGMNAQAQAMMYRTKTGKSVSLFALPPAKPEKPQATGFLQALNLGAHRAPATKSNSPRKPKA